MAGGAFSGYRRTSREKRSRKTKPQRKSAEDAKFAKENLDEVKQISISSNGIGQTGNPVFIPEKRPSTCRRPDSQRFVAQSRHRCRLSVSFFFCALCAFALRFGFRH